MNARMLTVLTTTMLLVATSGCSGMRNFLFGRGARCGSCLSLPKLPGLGGKGSCLSSPSAPCSVGNAVSPPIVYAPAAPLQYQSAPCESCAIGNSYAGNADCGCSASSAYAPTLSSDPYLSSPPINGSIQSGGQIYDDSSYNGQPIYNESPVYNGAESYNGVPSGNDNFFRSQSRRFDTDGARILSVDPLP